MQINKDARKLAPDYDRRWSFYVEAPLRQTLSRLELEPGESLLDVGSVKRTAPNGAFHAPYSAAW